jgi:hypothetical protein
MVELCIGSRPVLVGAGGREVLDGVRAEDGISNEGRRGRPGTRGRCGRDVEGVDGFVDVVEFVGGL